MTIPPPPSLPPAPNVGDMSVPDLLDLVERRDVYRAKAVLELAARAPHDDTAVPALAEISRIAYVRNDRLFHRVSLAWAAVIGLLAAETPAARAAAYRAFADLDPGDRADLLTYLRADRIEDAHPAPL